MPQFSFAPAQMDALTTALLSLTNRSQNMPRRLGRGGAADPNYQPAGQSRKADDRAGLLQLPSINGRGGDMAPDLTWEGSSVQRQWLRRS